MRGVARLGDRTHGTCFHPSHNPPLVTGGTIITGSPDDLTNEKLTARLGDKVLTDCGHIAEIITGSPSVITNDKLTARLADKVDNGAPYKATIITASQDRILDD